MSFLKRIFGGNEKLQPADLSVLGTDVHSHFIPGIDDGSESLEMSIELIEAMAGYGYKKVITTPHVMSDYYKNTPEIILGGLDKVREGVQKAGLDIEVDAAAEYYLDFEMEQLIKEKQLLTFGQNYVLFELPFISEPPMLADSIFNMQMAGYKPVLAHPERYTYWYDQYEKYAELSEKGVILQLNINSLTGYYSPATKKISERLVKDGLIRLLGSDCHHMNHTRLMQSARKEKGIHQLLESGNLLNSTL